MIKQIIFFIDKKSDKSHSNNPEQYWPIFVLSYYKDMFVYTLK